MGLIKFCLGAIVLAIIAGVVVGALYHTEAMVDLGGKLVALCYRVGTYLFERGVPALEKFGVWVGKVLLFLLEKFIEIIGRVLDKVA